MARKSFLKRVVVLLSTTLVGGLMLAGCSSSNDKSKEGGNGKLVIYSNSVADGRGDWLKEKASEAGFNIEIVDGGGGDLENRLVAEKNNPIADLVFGLNSMTFEKLKENELLDKYVPSWAGDISEGLNDPDGYYHSLVKQAILLIYNSEQYDEKTAPKDWTDLWNNKEFHGKYEVQSSLNGGTTRVVLAGILSRHIDPNGELGISKKGWEEVEKFYKYGVRSVEGEDFYANLASGKTPMGQMWSSGIEAREEQYGVKAGLVNPNVGVPYVVEQIGIINGSKNIETAQKFVDWFGSDEIQGEWSEKFSTMPANTKAMDKANEQNKFISENYKQQDIDWSFVTKHVDEWMEKIELEYMR